MALPYKHKDLSSTPRHVYKKLGVVVSGGISLQSQHWGSGGRTPRFNDQPV